VPRSRVIETTTRQTSIPANSLGWANAHTMDWGSVGLCHPSPLVSTSTDPEGNRAPCAVRVHVLNEPRLGVDRRELVEGGVAAAVLNVQVRRRARGVQPHHLVPCHLVLVSRAVSCGITVINTSRAVAPGPSAVSCGVIDSSPVVESPNTTPCNAVMVRLSTVIRVGRYSILVLSIPHPRLAQQVIGLVGVQVRDGARSAHPRVARRQPPHGVLRHCEALLQAGREGLSE